MAEMKNTRTYSGGGSKILAEAQKEEKTLKALASLSGCPPAKETYGGDPRDPSCRCRCRRGALRRICRAGGSRHRRQAAGRGLAECSPTKKPRSVCPHQRRRSTCKECGGGRASARSSAEGTSASREEEEEEEGFY